MPRQRTPQSSPHRPRRGSLSGRVHTERCHFPRSPADGELQCFTSQWSHASSDQPQGFVRKVRTLGAWARLERPRVVGTVEDRQAGGARLVCSLASLLTHSASLSAPPPCCDSAGCGVILFRPYNPQNIKPSKSLCFVKCPDSETLLGPHRTEAS